MKYAYIGFAVLIVGFLGWSALARSNDPTVVATHGLHWHAMLSIEVGTTTVSIPEGLGLGALEMAVHTHDTSGEIHMEFSGVVRHADLTLGHVFDAWGKPIDSFGSNMRMTVNGATSTAYGSYEMHDGDTIVLKYE